MEVKAPSILPKSPALQSAALRYLVLRIYIIIYHQRLVKLYYQGLPRVNRLTPSSRTQASPDFMGLRMANDSSETNFSKGTAT